MLLTGIRFRRLSIVTIISLLAQLALIACLIWAIILSTNSDEHFPELLRKLRPAGNCLCESSTVFDCKWTQSLRPSNNALVTGATDTTEEAWQFKHGRDDDDLGMSEDRCNAAFPGLFEEVHRAVGWRIEQGRNVTRADLDAVTIERGRIRAMIVDGKIRVLEASHSFDDHRKRALATLYSIHRAISADPKAIPNIEFIISLDDMVDTPSQSIWALTRRSQDQNLWLVPDFGFWSWDLDDIGAIDDVAEQIIRDEGTTGWDAKIQKLVWRGTTKMLPKLRGALLDASRGKTWGDVAALTPGSPPKNYLGAADQCKYMFLAHAEGVYIVRFPLMLDMSAKTSPRSQLLRILEISTTLSIGNSHSQATVDPALPLPPCRTRYRAELCRSRAGFLRSHREDGIPSITSRRGETHCGQQCQDVSRALFFPGGWSVLLARVNPWLGRIFLSTRDVRIYTGRRCATARYAIREFCVCLSGRPQLARSINLLI